MKQECVEEVTHSKVKVEEKGRKAVFLNDQKNKYSVGRIDGCIVTDGIRSDYFVSDSGHIALIELKGCDVSQACKQLFATASHENMKAFMSNKKIGFLIVCSRVPRTTTTILKSKNRARRDYGAGFHVVSGKGEFTINAITSIGRKF